MVVAIDYLHVDAMRYTYNRKKNQIGQKITSAAITLVIISILVLMGPTIAVIVDVATDSTYYKNGIQNVTFTTDIDIESDEKVPIQNISLIITGPTNKTCVFYPTGQAISGCGNISITSLNLQGFGYGYSNFGYGYGYTGSGYGRANQTFGYDYGYGHTAGYDSSGYGGELRYNVTWNITGESAAEGNYTVDLQAFAQTGSNFRVYQDDSLASFVVDQTAPSITSFSVSPSSLLKLASVSISASISDSQSGVNTKTVKVTKPTGSSTSASFTSPYTYTGTTVAGNYHVEILATDVAGNQVNLTTTNAFSVADTGTSAGGGGGGASGGAAGGLGATAESASYISLVSNVKAGKETSIEFSDQASKDTGVSEIEFTALKDLPNVQVKVTKVSEPTGISIKVGGKVFGYIEIKVSGATDKDLEKVKIKFQVPKSWLTQNGVSADQVALNRYADDKWNELSTAKLNEDGENVYFEAESPGLSVFAITTKAAVSQPSVPTTMPPVTTTLPTPTTTVRKLPELPVITKEPGKSWATLLLGILLVVLLALIVKKFVMKEQKPMVYNTTL